MLLLHYGIDWSDRNWAAARRGDYWDNLLPTRVRLATYNSIDLHQWWTASAARLGSAPRTDEHARSGRRMPRRQNDFALAVPELLVMGCVAGHEPACCRCWTRDRPTCNEDS
ncbi:hypothetical protein [Rhodococcus koreensis]|uniref:hypothetical protein n=1 Tax=Rhodococcus koreensis TaxID=99653 RepID=UPI001F123F41|nr:hypothetical protein [Rhodococcus koreensis]